MYRNRKTCIYGRDLAHLMGNCKPFDQLQNFQQQNLAFLLTLVHQRGTLSQFSKNYLLKHSEFTEIKKPCVYRWRSSSFNGRLQVIGSALEFEQKTFHLDVSITFSSFQKIFLKCTEIKPRASIDKNLLHFMDDWDPFGQL